MKTPSITYKQSPPVFGRSSTIVLIDGQGVGQVREDGTNNVSNPSGVSRGWSYQDKKLVRSADWYPTQRAAIFALLGTLEQGQ